MKFRFIIITASMAGAAWAHGDTKLAKPQARPISTDERDFGREGDPKKATRTVRISMADTMRFTPSELNMPAMTMVFQVKDPALLDKVKTGDKVKFEAQKFGGAFTVTRIEAQK